jgi:hypothetical protein
MKLRGDVAANLGKLPKGLESTYSHICDEIFSQEEQCSDTARAGLMWIMCAQQPLKVNEWIAATCYSAFLSEESSVDVLLDICHQLVVVDHTLNVVRFCHLSVMEYLQKEYFTPEDAHFMAAESCMSVFEFDNVFEPLSQYSVEHWTTHIILCTSPEYHDQSLRILRQFLGEADQPSQAYRNWVTSLQQCKLQNYDPNLLYAVHSNRIPPNPLFAAAWFPFGARFPELWELERSKLDCTNDYGLSLLLVACLADHEEVVKILLEKGADPNYGEDQQHPPGHPASTYRSPLRTAILNAHHKIITMLLDYGATINGSQPSGTDDLLNMVSQHAESATVEDVLARFPTVSVTEATIRAAVKNLSHGVTIVQLLLEHDPNFSISEYVLISALENYKTGRQVIEFLLEKLPNLEIPWFVTKRAVESGVSAVKLLLPGLHDDSIQRAGLMAFELRKFDILELLLTWRYDYAHHFASKHVQGKDRRSLMTCAG